MANDQHLALLRQGVSVWNEWRERRPDIRPDLSQADLSKAYLPRGHLSGVDLTKSELKRRVPCGREIRGG